MAAPPTKRGGASPAVNATDGVEPETCNAIDPEEMLRRAARRIDEIRASRSRPAYLTEEEARFAWWALNTMAFDVWELDEWLAEPDWQSTAHTISNHADLVDLRKAAMRALNARSTDLARSRIREIASIRQLVKAREALIPMARAGKKHGEVQAARRKDKPSDDPADSGRNERIRGMHSRLVAEGRHDATSETAREFGLSTRTISRIVRSV